MNDENQNPVDEVNRVELGVDIVEGFRVPARDEMPLGLVPVPTHLNGSERTAYNSGVRDGYLMASIFFQGVNQGRAERHSPERELPVGTVPQPRFSEMTSFKWAEHWPGDDDNIWKAEFGLCTDTFTAYLGRRAGFSGCFVHGEAYVIGDERARSNIEMRRILSRKSFAQALLREEVQNGHHYLVYEPVNYSLKEVGTPWLAITFCKQMLTAFNELYHHHISKFLKIIS